MTAHLPTSKRPRIAGLAVTLLALGMVLGLASADGATPDGAQAPTQLANFDLSFDNGDDGEALNPDIDAARERWDTMTPDQRERVLTRWSMLRQLDNESRTRVIANFDRLKQWTRDQQGSDSPALEMDARFYRRVESYVHETDDVERQRLRTLHEELGDVHRADPDRFQYLHQLTPESRHEEIDRWRRDGLERMVERMAESLGLTPDQQATLLEILDHARQESDAVHREYRQRYAEIDRLELEQLTAILGDEEAARALQRRLRHGGDDDRARRRFDSDEPPPIGPDTLRRVGLEGWNVWRDAATGFDLSEDTLSGLHEVYAELERNLRRTMADAMAHRSPPDIEALTQHYTNARQQLSELSVEPDVARVLSQKLIAPSLKRLAGDGDRRNDRSDRDDRRPNGDRGWDRENGDDGEHEGNGHSRRDGSDRGRNGNRDPNRSRDPTRDR